MLPRLRKLLSDDDDIDNTLQDREWENVERVKYDLTTRWAEVFLKDGDFYEFEASQVETSGIAEVSFSLKNQKGLKPMFTIHPKEWLNFKAEFIQADKILYLWTEEEE